MLFDVSEKEIQLNLQNLSNEYLNIDFNIYF
jgi:hypothetical protein